MRVLTIDQRHIHTALDEARRIATESCYIPPIDIRRVARRLGVQSIEPRRIKSEGYLGVGPGGGLVVRYREDQPASRIRFTIAHELGHVLLSRAQGAPITCRMHRAAEYDSAEERAANRIAAELLMPEGYVRGDIQGRNASWLLLRGLAHRFQVSETAMVLRILELRGVYALLARISVESVRSRSCPSYRYDFSEHTPVRLTNPQRAEAKRLWTEAMHCCRHKVRVALPFGTYPVYCEGLVRSMKTAYSMIRQYWVLGWMG